MFITLLGLVSGFTNNTRPWLVRPLYHIRSLIYVCNMSAVLLTFTDHFQLCPQKLRFIFQCPVFKSHVLSTFVMDCFRVQFESYVIGIRVVNVRVLWC